MSFKKEFILGETWNEATASRVEVLLNRLSKLALHANGNTYTGDGLATKTILVPDMGNPPIAIVIQNEAGAHTLVVAPHVNNGIVSWNQKGFTVIEPWNINGNLYVYVVIS